MLTGRRAVSDVARSVQLAVALASQNFTADRAGPAACIAAAWGGAVRESAQAEPSNKMKAASAHAFA